MIKQYMVDVELCPHCGGAAYPFDVHFFYVDEPAPAENFLWSYQEKDTHTIEIQYRCACGMWNDRLQVFCDYNGDLYISPLQIGMDKQLVLKPPVKTP